MIPRLAITLKFLHQIGPLPLVLNLLYKAGVKTGVYRSVERKDWDGGEEKIRGLFKLPGRDDLHRVLGKEGARILLDEAEEIVDGKIRLFGGEPIELYLAFTRPIQHWTAYEREPQLLSSFRFTHDDIKFAWEPARFGWTYTLGRAYHFTGEERFAEAFWKYFEQFNIANPPYLGPHWMNGQEAALRLMALAWAAQVFENASASTTQRQAALRDAMMAHGSRIPPTLLYARSQNNNHLVTEAAGLYTAGLALGILKWRDMGWRWLNWSFENQIRDGEYIQHSANYHRLVLQAALYVDAIKDTAWPCKTSLALERASQFLLSMLDPVSGQVPNLGANDGALILPLSSTGFGDYRPTAQASVRAFLKARLPSGPWDELSLWLGLEDHPRGTEPGHALSRDLRGKDSWAYLRASRFKSRLGHMDQLHLDLWWRGLNITRDAGTYLYNGDPPWDNPMVSARLHNTVTVDGRDPMIRGGRFLVLDWFPAYAETLSMRDLSVLRRIKAWHDGYRTVRHERVVTIHGNEDWTVEDKLIPRRTGFHSYRLHWLLPDWEAGVRSEEGREVSIRSPEGRITFTIHVSPEVSNLRFSMVRAGELLHGEREVLPYEGWFSPTYGVKIPALSVALEVESSTSLVFTTQIRFPA